MSQTDVAPSAKRTRRLGAALSRWRTRSAHEPKAPSEPLPDHTPTSVRVPFALIVILGLVGCALMSLLPPRHALLPFELASATYGVLVLPGAVILRLVGWPRSLASALPACVAWSLTSLAVGFALMLVTGGGLLVAVLWQLAVIAVGLVLGRGTPVEVDLSSRRR